MFNDNKKSYLRNYEEKHYEVSHRLENGNFAFSCMAANVSKCDASDREQLMLLPNQSHMITKIT